MGNPGFWRETDRVPYIPSSRRIVPPRHIQALVESSEPEESSGSDESSDDMHENINPAPVPRSMIKEKRIRAFIALMIAVNAGRTLYPCYQIAANIINGDLFSHNQHRSVSLHPNGGFFIAETLCNLSTLILLTDNLLERLKQDVSDIAVQRIFLIFVNIFNMALMLAMCEEERESSLDELWPCAFIYSVNIVMSSYLRRDIEQRVEELEEDNSDAPAQHHPVI